jgi:predicted Fe-S protein YdhL (DUF1289 family)
MSRSICVPGRDAYVGRSTSILVMATILSPCEKICVVDPVSGLCRGCGRSLSEIERWTAYSDDERARLMSEFRSRLESMAAPRAGKTTPAG